MSGIVTGCKLVGKNKRDVNTEKSFRKNAGNFILVGR